MSSFFAGPAMARLVAQQSAEDQSSHPRRGRPVRPSRAERRARRARQRVDDVADNLAYNLAHNTADVVGPGRLARVARSLRLAH